MYEQNQSDDFYIPANFLNLPPQPETRNLYTQAEDFLKNAYRWIDIFPLEECPE